MAAISTQSFFEKEGIHPENVEEYFLRGGNPGYAQENTPTDESAGVEGYATANEEASQEEEEGLYYEEEEVVPQATLLRGGALATGEEEAAEEYYAEEDYYYADAGAEEYDAEVDGAPYADPAADADTSAYGYAPQNLRGGGGSEDEGADDYYYENQAVDGSAVGAEEYEAEDEDWAAGVEEYAEDEVNPLRGGGSVEDSTTGVEEYVTALEPAEEQEYAAEEENYEYAGYDDEENAYAEPEYYGEQSAWHLRGGGAIDVAPAPDQIPVDENGNIIGSYVVPVYSEQGGQEPQMLVQVIQADQQPTGMPTVVSIDADGTVSTIQPNQLVDAGQGQHISMMIDMNALAAQMQAAQIEGQTLSVMQGQQQTSQLQMQPMQQMQQMQPLQQTAHYPPAPPPPAPLQPAQLGPAVAPKARSSPPAPGPAPASAPKAGPSAKGKSGPAAAKAAKAKSAPVAKGAKGAKASAPPKSKSKAPKAAAPGGAAKSKTAAKGKSAAPKAKAKV